jgi:hypothetical protein
MCALSRAAGLCLDPPEPLIVTEFYPRGNLFDLIQKVRLKGAAPPCVGR